MFCLSVCSLANDHLRRHGAADHVQCHLVYLELDIAWIDRVSQLVHLQLDLHEQRPLVALKKLGFIHLLFCLLVPTNLLNISSSILLN
jgi:hypothetical protein